MNETRLKEFSLRYAHVTFHRIVSREWFGQLWRRRIIVDILLRYRDSKNISHLPISEEIRISASAGAVTVVGCSGWSRKWSARLCYDVLDIPFFLVAEETATWPPTTSPTSVKIHKIYLCIESVKIHKNIFMHYVQNIIQSVPKPSDVF